jgi:hypothetical protein
MEAMAGAIRRTCDDATGRIARVAAARARVECELSFDSRMDKLEAMYEELIDVRRAGAA